MKVKIYTAVWCPWCKRTKEFLNSKGVKFEEIDVDKNHDAVHEIIEKTGQTGIPVTEIDGEIIIGYDKVALENALNKGR